MIEIVLVLCRLTVGMAFFMAGVLKMHNPNTFAHFLSTFDGLSPFKRRMTVRVLPVAEISLGALLLTGVHASSASIAAVVLSLAFSAAALMAVNQEHFDCGCFGSILSARTKRGLATRNVVLALLAMAPAIGGTGVASLQSFAGLEVSLAAVAAGVAAIVLIHHLLHLPAQGTDSGGTPLNAGRRSFLSRTAALAVGGAMAVVVGGLATVRPAEAACSYCGSCSNTYLWIGCTGNCCANFWVRMNKYCSGSCLSCSAWWIEEHCGYSQCC